MSFQFFVCLFNVSDRDDAIRFDDTLEWSCVPCTTYSEALACAKTKIAQYDSVTITSNLSEYDPMSIAC